MRHRVALLYHRRAWKTVGRGPPVPRRLRPALFQETEAESLFYERNERLGPRTNPRERDRSPEETYLDLVLQLCLYSER